jgi:hypothetical protein
MYQMFFDAIITLLAGAGGELPPDMAAKLTLFAQYGAIIACVAFICAIVGVVSWLFKTLVKG